MASKRKRNRQEPQRKARAKRRFLPQISVFGAAFLVRLILIAELKDFPLVRTPQLDSLEYVNWARRIVSDGLSWWPPEPSHGPGYPYFLAALLSLFGGSLTAVRVAQSLLGAALCVLVAKIGEAYFDRRVGLVAGLSLALYGPLAFLDISILGEGLLLFLLVLAVWGVSSEGASIRRFAAAGVVLGLGALVRPTALALLPILMAAAVLSRRGHRRGWLAAFLLAAACALTIAPAVAINARKGNGFPVIQTYGGFNFYLGNSPGGSGLAAARLGGNWDRLVSEARRRGLVRAADQDRYYVNKALSEIRSRPLGYLELLGKKLFWTLQADEVRDSHSIYFFEAEAAVLRWLPGFGLLFPLAAVGFWVSAGQRPRPWLLYGYLAAMASTGVLLVVGMRYRMPIVPVLALFSALGLLGLLERLREKSLSRIAAPAGILLGTLLLSQAKRHAPTHNFAEEWTLSGYSLIGERDLAGARAAFERALTSDPSYSGAWGGLGLVRLNRGELREAEEALRHSLDLEPDNQQSRYDLGVTYEREGRLEEAAAQYRRSLDLAPEDVPSREALGRTLFSQRKLAEAEAVFRQIVASHPDDFVARLGLARIYGAERRFEDGVQEAKKAASIDPRSSSAWFTLGMLAIADHQTALAGTAFQKVVALGEDETLIRDARAMLSKLSGAPRREASTPPAEK